MERNEAMEGFDKMADEALMWDELRKEDREEVEYPLFPNPFAVADIIAHEREHTDKA